MRLSKMISAIDVHACGELGRVIVGGVLDVPGKTMFEKKTYLETQADDLRKLILREPLPRCDSNHQWTRVDYGHCELCGGCGRPVSQWLHGR